MYDHPFQWGSKRTGPDLARVGGRYSDEWHKAHLIDPRSVVPESIMPPYAFLAERELKAGDMARDLTALYRVGVPYTKIDIAKANDRSEEHTSELQSLMRISYAVFCLNKKTTRTRLRRPTHMS